MLHWTVDLAARVELRTTVSAFPTHPLLGLGFRVTARSNRRVQIEGGLEWTDAFTDRHYADQLIWFYFWQVRHTLRKDRRSRVFATYGTAGWLQRQSVPPDGRLKASIAPPVFANVGLGEQYLVSDHIAIRIDGQLIIWPFATPRVSVGLTVPISRTGIR